MIELGKRIVTSIFLFVASVFAILIDKYAFVTLVIIASIICFYEWRKVNYKYFKLNEQRNLKYFFIQILGLAYLLIFLYAAISLRGSSFESALFIIIILCICIFSDIGGYVFGKLIGGKKLTKISPNKTISGSLGSFIFSIVPILLLNFQNYFFIPLEVSLKNILLCLIISSVCQFGDLLISYFKRLNNIKDTGTILPGHGGLLDRIDGLIFAIPAAYLLKILEIF